MSPGISAPTSTATARVRAAMPTVSIRSPVFGFMADSGEHEINEEDTPIIRLGAQRLAKDRIGWGMYRAGMGYEQIATSRGSPYWGFMTGCEGSKFPSAQGLDRKSTRLNSSH